mmetsp:Transcript_33088/g.48307  ORF Transcript_33088/g.48307 Transcript_33088/m.48307 type:complete len:193 (-) Transcript_33088:303-881(-)
MYCKKREMESYLKNIIVLLVLLLASVSAAEQGLYTCEKCCPELHGIFCCEDDIPGCVCEELTIERAFFEDEVELDDAGYDRWYVRHTRRKQRRISERKWKREATMCLKFDRKLVKVEEKEKRFDEKVERESAKNARIQAYEEKLAAREESMVAKDRRVEAYEGKLDAMHERMEDRKRRVATLQERPRFMRSG